MARRIPRAAVALAAMALVVSCGARFPRTQTVIGANGQPTTIPDNGGGLGGDGLQPGTTTGPGGGPIVGPSGGVIVPGGGGGGGGGGPSGGPSSGPSTGPSTGPTGGGGGGGGPVDPGSTEGISATNINIAYLVPVTGAAPVPPQFQDGIKAYWNYLKSKGGIYGRNVTPQIYDTKSTDSGARAAAQRAIDNHAAFVVALDRLGVQGTIMRYLDQRGIPNVEVQTPVDVPGNLTWTFSITIDHRAQGKLIADYFADVLKAKKVGVVHENDDTLKPGVEAFQNEAKAKGMSVFSDQIDQSQNQFVAEARTLQGRNADVAWLYMAPIPAANLANESDSIGYHPTWFANSISWNFNLVLTGGYQGLKGAKAFSPWPSYLDPRTKSYTPYRPSGGPSAYDLGIPGWGIGQILANAIKNAGKALGRNGFRNAMQHLKLTSISPVDGTAMLWNPVTFTDGVREGGQAVMTLKVVGSSSRDAAWGPEADYRTGY